MGGEERLRTTYMKLEKTFSRGKLVTATEQANCFLCQPDGDLIVGRHGRLFSMVGLGPITDRYLMIASAAHITSFADFYLQDKEIASEIQALREQLQGGGNQLLMTEHGRVPACLEDGDEHDAHCFHAHFLLFQSNSDIEELASSYFMERSVFADLSEALAYASTNENYHLLSPRSNRYVVFTGALNVPRQFFRYLVAMAEDQPEKADWRELPNREKAAANAANERAVFGV